MTSPYGVNQVLGSRAVNPKTKHLKDFTLHPTWIYLTTQVRPCWHQTGIYEAPLTVFGELLSGFERLEEYTHTKLFPCRQLRLNCWPVLWFSLRFIFGRRSNAAPRSRNSAQFFYELGLKIVFGREIKLRLASMPRDTYYFWIGKDFQE